MDNPSDLPDLQKVLRIEETHVQRVHFCAVPALRVVTSPSLSVSIAVAPIQFHGRSRKRLVIPMRFARDRKSFKQTVGIFVRMAERYRVEVGLRDDKIVFPSVCTNCLSPYPSEKFGIEKAYVIGTPHSLDQSRIAQKTTYSVEVPLCSSCEERYHPSILGKLLPVSIFLFLCIGLLGAYSEGEFPSGGNLLLMIVGGLIIGSVVMVPIYVIVRYAIEKIRGYPPVRLDEVSYPSATFSFTNKQYADMFRQANEPAPGI